MTLRRKTSHVEEKAVNLASEIHRQISKSNSTTPLEISVTTHNIHDAADTRQNAQADCEEEGAHGNSP